MATTVARMEAVLDTDNSRFNRGMTQAESRMGSATKRLGKLAVLGGLALGAGLAVGTKKAIDAASDLNESVNAVNVVFGKASKQVLEFSRNAATKTGLSMRALNQAVTPIGAALRNVGMSADETARQSINLTQRAADMASVFNVDVEEALTAIQAGLRGEMDPLERFGVGLSQASIEAFAVKKGMIEVGEEMTNSQRVTARLGLLFEQTNRIAGDFENTSGGLANQQRILRAEVENLGARLGTVLLPAATKVVSFITEKALPVFERFAGFIEDIFKANTAHARIRIVWEGVSSAAGDFWDAFHDALFTTTTRKPIRLPSGKILEWDTRTQQGLIDSIAEGIAAVDWGNVAKEMAKGLIKAAGDAFGQLNEWGKKNVTPENFIRLLGLDPGKDYGGDLWRWMKRQLGTALSKIGSAFKPDWTGLFHWLRQQWSAFVGDFTSILASLKRPVVGTIEFMRDNWRTLMRFMTGGISDFVESAIALFKRIKERAEALWGRVRDVVSPVVDQFEDMVGWLKDAVGWIKDLIGWIGKIPSLPKLPGPGGLLTGDGLIGAGGGPRDISSTLWDDLALANQDGLILTSGYRPGAVTSTGNPSLHGLYPSKAIDVAGSPGAMRSFFLQEVMRGATTGLREIIHSPYWWHPGAGIQQIPASAGSVLADHYSHVHVGSYDRGGYLRPGWNLAYNGLGRPEPVGGGNTYNFNGAILDGQKLLRFIQEEQQRYGKRNGG